jgi:hypothetical protein
MLPSAALTGAIAGILTASALIAHVAIDAAFRLIGG